MYLVAIAWVYVVLMMAVAEALSTQGTVVGGVVTFVLYGVMPLSIVLYIMGTPGRKRRLTQAELAAAGAVPPPLATAVDPSLAPSVAPSVMPSMSPSTSPDGGSHAPGDAIASERKEV